MSPDAVLSIGKALVAVGITRIEVPLNSPDPLRSIALLAREFPGPRIGADTVLDPAGVARVQAAGGRLIVSPHTNPEVIRATREAGMTSSPGAMTPTECFTALRAGADGC